MKILAIKTNDFFLITDNVEKKQYFDSRIPQYLYDGEKPENTYKQHWYKIKNKPEKIQKLLPKIYTNKRFELKPEFENSTFKKVWLENIVKRKDEDYNDYFIDEFDGIKGLYDFKYDIQPESFQDIDFEWEQILEIEVFNEPEKFNYEIRDNCFNNLKVTGNINNSNVQHDFIAAMLIPSILLHDTPCKLSPFETFNIIASHIKNNIDSKHIKIQDYIGSFKVVKTISLTKPYSYNVEEIKKGKTIYNTRYINERDVVLFEMTHSERNKGHGEPGYTCITPFTGKNQTDLKNNIDKYLNDLMAHINQPFTECECCNGKGVIFNETFKTN